MVFESRSPEETEALGRRVGERAGPGTLVALVGDLGSGKTRFVKGFAAGAGDGGACLGAPCAAGASPAAGFQS